MTARMAEAGTRVKMAEGLQDRQECRTQRQSTTYAVATEAAKTYKGPAYNRLGWQGHPMRRNPGSIDNYRKILLYLPCS